MGGRVCCDYVELVYRRKEGDALAERLDLRIAG